MSDLVERLRDYDRTTAATDMVEAADRIEALEAALQKIANPSTVAGMHEQDRDRKLREIARAALAPEQDK